MIEEFYRVRHYEFSPQGTLTPWGLQNFFQETACNDANSLGCGFEHLRPKNLAWVLTKLQMHFFIPNSKSFKVKVITWPVESSKLTTRRDFRIFDENNALIVAGTTQWVIIDLSSRRLIRLPSFVLDCLPKQKAEYALDTDFVRQPLDLSKQIPLNSYEVNSRLEDLDINGHINNQHFTAWALQGVPEEIQKDFNLTNLCVLFKSEICFGENIKVLTYSASETNSFWHILVNKEGKEYSAVFSQWTKKETL